MSDEEKTENKDGEKTVDGVADSGREECKKDDSVKEEPAKTDSLEEEEDEGYFGTEQHNIDDKNRIKIPVFIRNQIKGKFRLCKGVDDSICVYDMAGAKKRVAQLRFAMRQPRLKQATANRLKAMISSFTEPIEEDAQGRFNLPQYLMTWAGLSKKSKVYSLGVGDHVEIWSSDKYEAVHPVEEEEEFADLSEFGIY